MNIPRPIVIGHSPEDIGTGSSKGEFKYNI